MEKTWPDVFQPAAFYDQLTTAALNDAAREYLNAHRYVQVTLRPKQSRRQSGRTGALPPCHMDAAV